jgi:hypothetical protein
MRKPTKKPKRGRPSLGKKAKKRLNVMLSTPIAARFRASGDGNLSGGIEAAVPEFIGAKPKEIPNLKPQRMPNDPTPSGFEEKKRSLNDSTRKSTMDATVDARNPTGITLTQAQKDRLMREGYWDHAIRYGLEFYVAGRFAIAHGFTPVGANILHDGVELLLKACLAHDDPLDRILDYWHPKRGYGHDIVRLWQDFKARRDSPVPAEFDAVVEALHAFRDIAYPEKLIRDGAMILIDIFDVPELPSNGNQGREPMYRLKLPQIDRLMGVLFDASGANPPAFLPRVTDDKRALFYYDKLRSTLFGRPAIATVTPVT